MIICNHERGRRHSYHYGVLWVWYAAFLCVAMLCFVCFICPSSLRIRFSQGGRVRQHVSSTWKRCSKQHGGLHRTTLHKLEVQRKCVSTGVPVLCARNNHTVIMLVLSVKQCGSGSAGDSRKNVIGPAVQPPEMVFLYMQILYNTVHVYMHTLSSVRSLQSYCTYLEGEGGELGRWGGGRTSITPRLWCWRGGRWRKRRCCQ